MIKLCKILIIMRLLITSDRSMGPQIVEILRDIYSKNVRMQRKRRIVSIRLRATVRRQRLISRHSTSHTNIAVASRATIDGVACRYRLYPCVGVNIVVCLSVPHANSIFRRRVRVRRRRRVHNILSHHAQYSNGDGSSNSDDGAA